MKYLHRFCQAGLLLGLTLLAQGTSTAADPTGWVTQEEMATLPELCQVKELKRGQAAYDSYMAQYGPDFGHMHHYCYALVFEARYHKYKLHAPTRLAILQNALNNLNYVIGHANPSFVLLADVYYLKGSLLSEERRWGEALQSLGKAIEVSPRYTRAYMALADAYIEMKQKDKALGTITEGLRQVPTSKLLQRRYDELGGKKPYPEPYAKAEPEAPKEAADAAAKPAASASEITPASVRSLRDAAGKEDGTAPAEPRANASGNPWCRFCPDEDRSSPPAPSTPAAAPTTAR